MGLVRLRSLLITGCVRTEFHTVNSVRAGLLNAAQFGTSDLSRNRFGEIGKFDTPDALKGRNRAAKEREDVVGHFGPRSKTGCQDDKGLGDQPSDRVGS